MTIMLNQAITPFTAACTSIGEFALDSFTGKKLVLYFYPKDNTPGCTTEGMQFRDLHDAFLANNALIFGISRDSLKSHDNFKTKLGLPFDLIADTDETVCQLFDVIKMKNMYGKQVRGIERSTFVLNEQGILIKAWRGIKVAGHVEEVLDFIKAM